MELLDPASALFGVADHGLGDDVQEMAALRREGRPEYV